MDSNAQELLRQSNRMFSKKDDLDNLWQKIAEEICPDRATFTTTRVVGAEFTDHLYTSLPAQNHRDLSYAMGSLTRPKNQKWFDVKARDDDRNTEMAKKWFTMARNKQWTLLYSHRANFLTTMEISDRDVCAFGNSVVSQSESPMRDGTLIYQAHHLRDCAWTENKFRFVDRVDRKFKLCLRNWEVMFPGKPMPKDYQAIMKEDPYHEIDLLHIVMPAHGYEPYNQRKRRNKQPFASIYVDPAHALILRERSFWEFPYVIRRWQLQEGTPYARSPASDLGLVEARLLQNQERVINDAGELAVDPPWVGTKDAIVGDLNNYPGGITWTDYEYDERMGLSARPVEYKGNLPIGLEMKMDTRQILAAAMFINKLTLPVGGPEMTVPEVNERISEYIRSIGPAVEPFEHHNAMMLDSSFTFNLRIGQFGPIQQVPQELKGADVIFEFDGPIQVAQKRQKLNKIVETVQVIKPIAEAQVAAGKPPDVLDNFDLDQMARLAAEHIDVEPECVVPFERVEQVREERAKQIAEAQQKAEMQQMAKLGIEGAKALPQMMEGDAGLEQRLGAAQGMLPQGGEQQQLQPLPGFEDDGGGAESLGQLANMWSGNGGGEELDDAMSMPAPSVTPDMGGMMMDVGGASGPEDAGDDDLADWADEAEEAPVMPPPQRAPARGAKALPAPAPVAASANDKAIADLVKLLSAKIEIKGPGGKTYTVERQVT